MRARLQPRPGTAGVSSAGTKIAPVTANIREHSHVGAILPIGRPVSPRAYRASTLSTSPPRQTPTLHLPARSTNGCGFRTFGADAGGDLRTAVRTAKLEP